MNLMAAMIAAVMADVPDEEAADQMRESSPALIKIPTVDYP